MYFMLFMMFIYVVNEHICTFAHIFLFSSLFEFKKFFHLHEMLSGMTLKKNHSSSLSPHF